MTSPALAQLLTPAALAALDALPDYSEATVMQVSARLRGEGHSPELVAELLTQSRLRLKAREKFGPFAEQMLFTAHGLEQSTRLAVAAHHAARFRDAGIETVADLGCGLGGDTIAKAGLGLTVIGVELDKATAALATVNTQMFETVRIEHGRAEDFDLTRVEAAWFDPARREIKGGRGERIHDPEEAMPPLSHIVQAARRLGSHGKHVDPGTGFGAVGAKLAPAIDHQHLVPGTETQWVSWKGQLLEACAYFGPLARPGIARSALVLQGEGARAAELLPDSSEDAALRMPPGGTIDAVILEPDPAVIRAGLLGTLARRLDAHTIDPTIAYLSAEHAPEPTPLAQAFRVREVLPFHTKAIASRLKEEGIGTLEIKKRGADIDPAQLRKQLKLSKKATDSVTLIVTRAAGERVAILAERLPSEAR